MTRVFVSRLRRFIDLSVERRNNRRPSKLTEMGRALGNER